MGEKRCITAWPFFMVTTTSNHKQFVFISPGLGVIGISKFAKIPQVSVYVVKKGPYHAIPHHKGSFVWPIQKSSEDTSFIMEIKNGISRKHKNF